jgi:Domain of unknown function (DUF4209)
MAITLDAAAVRQAIEEATLPICDEIYKVCRSRAAVAGPQQAEWEELRAICALYLAFDLEEDPTPLPGLDRLDGIADERLKEWAVLADGVGNPDLTARCSDLYWLRREHQKRVRDDIDRARTAIGAYITSATTLGIVEHSTQCFTRFQRALRLARIVNDGKQRASATNAMIDIIRARASTENGVGCLRLIGLLKSEDVDCAADCVEWCNTAAGSCAAYGAKTGDYKGFDLAAEYRKMNMYWLEKTGQAEKVPAEWLAIAGYYASVADIFERAGEKSPMYFGTATHWMERSIEALRAARAQEADIAAVHRRLLALQRQSLKAMELIESPINVTAMVKRAIAAVEGKDFPQAFVGLLTCVPRPSTNEIRELVARTPVMFRDMGNVRVNEEGKQVAIREGVDESEDAQWAAMIEKMRSCQLLMTEGGISHARNVFNAAYPMRREDLERMAAGSIFVPQSREKTWARGLHAGFMGDWMLVAHLLPPQVEHALRRLFEANGVITSGLHRSRQHEHDLNKLLTMKEAAVVLGEDLQLDLAASLAHGFGSNVRNYVAHGLFEDDHYRSLEVIYVWWQALRLALLPQVMFPVPAEAPAASSEAKRPDTPEGASPSEAAPPPEVSRP